jgi:hypothetical protein
MHGCFYIQVHYLNLISDRNRLFSCHFVKLPFAHEFKEFYFINLKAEEFKWWTANVLDHGLFEFWKRLQSHMLTFDPHTFSMEGRSNRSNISSVEALDVQNIIGQVHLIVFLS